MSHTEVISAFLDNEPFDARELADVLADAEGRDTLIQIIGLRHVVLASDHAIPAPERSRRRLPLVARAAIVVCALGAGYAAGAMRRQPADRAVNALSEPAPPPTIVVPRTPDTRWEPIRKGE